MFIVSVEIKKYYIFKNVFSADFCSGINIIIGGNSTGKTTLLKLMYEISQKQAGRFSEPGYKEFVLSSNENVFDFELDGRKVDITFNIKNTSDPHTVYIPEKDILEHAKGLLTFIEQKQTGFSQIYKDVLIMALDIPTKAQSTTQESVGKNIEKIIGGNVQWDKADGSFYTLKTDGSRIPFAHEASGYKKLGFLNLLVSSGQLEPGAILFWDEPENSLNPELMPELINILLELSSNGVQIFIATHSEILASYFAVNRNKGDNVMFYSLYKDNGQIKATSSDRFDMLEPNSLKAEIVKLYEKEIERGLSGNG